MMHPFLVEKLADLKIILKKYKVVNAYAFGSVCQAERFTDKSDIDLLVDFSNQLAPEVKGDLYFQLADELEVFFKRKVDLLTSQSLKNPYFIKSVNLTKTPIYG